MTDETRDRIAAKFMEVIEAVGPKLDRPLTVEEITERAFSIIEKQQAKVAQVRGDPDAPPSRDEIFLGELLSGKQDFAACIFSSDDFGLPAHGVIFQRMTDLYSRHEPINRITVANELMVHGELAHCGGLTYIVQLDGFGRAE